MSQQPDFDDSADDLYFVEGGADLTPGYRDNNTRTRPRGEERSSNADNDQFILEAGQGTAPKRARSQMRGDVVSLESDSGNELRFVDFEQTPKSDGRQFAGKYAPQTGPFGDSDDSLAESASDDQHLGGHPFNEYAWRSDDQKARKTDVSSVTRDRTTKASTLTRKYYRDHQLDMAHHFLVLSGVDVKGLENVNGRYERTNRIATERPIWDKFHTGKRNRIVFSGHSWWVLSSEGDPILQNQERTFVPPKRGWDIYIGEGNLRAAPQVTLTPAKVPQYAAALRTEDSESPVHNKLYREAEQLAMIRRYKSVTSDRRLHDKLKDASIHRDGDSRKFPLHLASRKAASKPPADVPVYIKRIPKSDLKDLRLLKLSTQKAMLMRECAEAERKKNSYDSVTRVRQDLDPISTLDIVAKMGPVRHAQRWVSRRNQLRSKERNSEDAHRRKVQEEVARPLSKRQQEISSKMHARSLGKTLTDGMISYLAEKEREDCILPPNLVQWATMEAEQESVIRLYMGGPPFGHYCPQILDRKSRLVQRWPNLPFQRKLPCDSINKMYHRKRARDPVQSANFLQRLALRTELQKHFTTQPKKAAGAPIRRPEVDFSSTTAGRRQINVTIPHERTAVSPSRTFSPLPPSRSRSPTSPQKVPLPVERGRVSPPQMPRPPPKRASFAPPPRVKGAKNSRTSGALPKQSACSKPISNAHRAYRKEMMRLGITFSPANQEINQTGYSSLLMRQERVRAQEGRASKKVLQKEVAHHVDLLHRDAKVRSLRKIAIRKARTTLARQQQKLTSVHEKAKGQIDPKWHHRLAIPRTARSDALRLYELRRKANSDSSMHPMEFKSKGFHLDKDKPDLTREEALRVGFVIWGGRNASTSAESKRVMNKVAERLLI
eukprot:GEMP01006600.1.p1 GENE.GEMP01006600.1~~GEMP01006600.1.p1  ORF type:complete len:890 (+),score=217.01 GEMP01006600.1:208-2877(+)